MDIQTTKQSDSQTNRTNYPLLPHLYHPPVQTMPLHPPKPRKYLFPFKWPLLPLKHARIDKILPFRLVQE